MEDARAGHVPTSAARAGRHFSAIELVTRQWQRERGDLHLETFLLGIYFMRLGTIVERSYDRMCRDAHGVSGGDMRVLLALRRGGLPYVKRPTDLFRALLVTSGAMTKKLDRLSDAGYVERLSDPGHQGGFLVRLTKSGLSAVEDAVERLAHDSVLAPAMRQFSPEERQAAAHLALRVLSALEQAQDEAESSYRIPSPTRSIKEETHP
jgi:DNA-binding MarR family transcriptional regulator